MTDLDGIRSVLERAGVGFERGMTDGEIRSVEERYELRFPPDLRAFLQLSLPVSKGWVDWRTGLRERNRGSLGMAARGHLLRRGAQRVLAR